MVLHALERSRPTGVGGGIESSRAITELSGRTGITVFLSDWYAPPEFVRQALGQVRARGHDVIAFHLIDPAERLFPRADDLLQALDRETRAVSLTPIITHQ